jgi:hypothetical protein
MDAPPPYDQVVSTARRSDSISLHSRDRLNPEDAGQATAAAGETTTTPTVEGQAVAPETTTRTTARRNRYYEPKTKARREDGGCM